MSVIGASVPARGHLDVAGRIPRIEDARVTETTQREAQRLARAGRDVDRPLVADTGEAGGAEARHHVGIEPGGLSLDHLQAVRYVDQPLAMRVLRIP